ncbi:MAG: hypothetical protein J5742_02045 [Alphaproteobacteria bacterium]|nr:hypothetical protein [Alphaproteobacteria bacterium]
MHIYHITQAYDDARMGIRTLMLSNGKDVPHSVFLRKNKKTENFKPGKKIIILRDKYLDMEDIVYICDGQLYFRQRPYLFDEYGCKCLIEYVGGLKDEYKLDRALLKFMIVRECMNNKIDLSRKFGKNLLNLLSKVKGC